MFSRFVDVVFLQNNHMQGVGIALADLLLEPRLCVTCLAKISLLASSLLSKWEVAERVVAVENCGNHWAFFSSAMSLRFIATTVKMRLLHSRSFPF